MFVPHKFPFRVLFVDCPEITDLFATSQTGDTVLYSVESQTPNARFTTDVNFASDTILTCVAGDVSQSSYVVVVRAKYQSDPGTYSDLPITITFTDQLSATGPTWNTGTSHTLDIEDANACNSVTTLSATSTDSSTVTYSIQGSRVFTITGSNILSCTLGNIEPYSYTVVVRANQDNNVPTDITLTITVTGFSVPFFIYPDPDSTKDGHKIYMCENIQKGDAVMTLNAYDEDSDYSSLIFSMDGSSDDVKALFEIVGNTLKIKSTVADNAFDYEKEGAVKSYAIVLKVTDVSGLSSTLETSIELEDDNEFAPVFTSASEAFISESSSLGATVIKLEACDQDPEFNKVSFSISGDDASSFSGSSKDEIIVKEGATFDYGTKSSYTLTVTASDSDPDEPRTADQELIIKILTAPLFTSPINNDKIDVNEDSTDGYLVKTLEASDEDGGTLTYTIVSQTPDDPVMFVVQNNELKTKGTFNVDVADAVQSYTLSLKVSDGNDKTDDDTIQVVINIKDSNTQTPKFKTGVSYEASVKETAEIGFKVLTVTATDDDLTETNNKVTYSLGSVTEFIIGESSGEITVAAKLSYNTKSSNDVTVTAKDNGGKSATQNVKITILTAPKFTSPINNDKIDVPEASADGSLVKTLEASDEDGDVPIYTIFSQTPDNPVKFAVQDNELKTNGTFNVDVADAVHSYTLSLKVSDGNDKTDDETIQVEINIKDSNTQFPKFKTGVSYEASVKETAEIGFKVLTVTATDDDLTETNNKITYSLGSVTEFIIGESSGEITVAAELSYNTKSSYDVTVTAKDNGGKSATQNVKITILAAPKFTSPINNDKIDLPEASADGSLVKTLVASDEDGDALIYTIVSQTPDDPVKFAVQNNELKTKGTFNVDVADAVQSYTLSLKVSDGNDKTDDETIQVVINIKDSNTQTPKFKTGVSYEASVKETAEIGFKVFTVTATDDDLTETNNKVTYSLGSVTEFSIGVSSGEITVAAELSYNTKSSYDVTVTAKDNGGKSATQNVKITALAEPVFTNIAEAVTREIKENVGGGTSVFQVTVQDSDDTWNDVIEIASQSPGEMFKMDGYTLKTNTNSFDAETTTAYEVTFKVTDGDFIVTSEKLTIHVLDVNDNKPSITAIEDITKPETLAVDEVVVDSIEATDKDISKPNNELVYAITSGNDGDIFKIEESSGKIQLNIQFSKSTYTLEVTVSDKGDPVLSATTEITINFDASTVDECADAPCKNGATCSSSVNKYSCQCVAGFEGKNCETNINECEPNPCLNEGSCTDGINMFTCDCAKGWGGNTCSSACTGNKYGKNCAQNCNCNATRLIENVTDQQCDIKEGACKCNANFVNATCEDKDECTENPAICGGQLHVMCENTIGSYTCDCKQFYRNESNVCKRYDEDKSVSFDQAKEIVVNANMAIGTAGDCPPGLEKKTVYNEIKRKIENSVKAAHPASKSVHAFNIRCGILKYELLIVVDKVNAAQLSKELSSTSNQCISYDGKQLSVNQLEVNDVDVKRIHTDKEQTCAVFNTIEQCSGDYSCEIQNGLPTCQKNEKEDNMNLILGLGLGVCLPLLVMAFIAGACLYRQLRRSQIDEKRQENGYSNKAFRKELSPWHGRMKQNGFKLDTKDYANGYKYDNDRFHDSFSGNKHHYDMPGLSYTSI